jgi:uncharacterized protein YwgA
MTDAEQLVAEVVSLAGGKVAGRVRLQKIFYLLDQLGLKSGLRYAYHHYGPYSSDLTEAISDAIAFKMIDERTERRRDGVGYSVYSTCRDRPAKSLGSLDLSVAQIALLKMQPASATVLELAATAHWLKHMEKLENWKAELVRRKGVKTESGRTEAALSLLSELGLG